MPLRHTLLFMAFPQTLKTYVTTLPTPAPFAW